MKGKIKKLTALVLTAVLSCSSMVFTSAVYADDETAVTFTSVLNSDNCTVGEYSSSHTEGDFTINATTSKTVEIVSSTSYEIAAADGKTYEISSCIKLGGTGSTSARNISFTPSKSGTFYAYAISNGDSTSRYLVLSDGTNVQNSDGSVTVPTSTKAPAVTEFSVKAGTTYYLYSARNGINVYLAALSEAEETEPEVVYTNVMPTSSDFTTTFDFKDSSSDTVKLVTQSSDEYSEGTAYAANAGTAYDDYCYVELTEEGAVLTDNSSSSSTRMIVPYANKTNKIRIYGSVIPTNAVSTNWRIITFGNGLNLGVNKNSSMYIDLAEDLSSSTGETAFGTVVKDQAIEFNLTFDLDTCTATGTIKNGETTGEVNTTWDSSTKYTQRVTYYTTLSQAGETARTIVVPSVSFEEKPVFDADSMTITGLDGTVYYVVPVTSSQQTDNTGYYLVSKNDSDNKSEVGDEVYIGLEVEGAQFGLSDLGITDPYVVAFEITGSGIDVDTIKDKYEMKFVPGDSAAEE
ncbi:MAG: hypothetical protein LUC92_03580 [Clostridiales bacterium]|nr:hypothetical protein [Clostridiales bacterium]